MERDGAARQHKRKSKGKSKKRSEKRKKTADEHENENDGNEAEEQRKARYQEYIRRIKDEYVPLHSELLDLTKWGFVDAFVLLCASPAESEDHLVAAGDGIYLMEIFTPEFCQLMLQEVNHFESWCAKQTISILRPNSMNNYGVVLDHIPGFSVVLQQFVQQFIEPLSRRLFPRLHPARSSATISSMDSHHGFVVEYGADKDKKLDWHVDDSDVTLNVCLGKQFEGGDLVFSGVRCELHRRDTPPLASKGENVRVAHLIGHGLLHVGKQRHAALPIKSGERTNFILWCRNSQLESSAAGHRRAICPSWCGWHRMSTQS